MGATESPLEVHKVEVLEGEDDKVPILVPPPATIWECMGEEGWHTWMQDIWSEECIPIHFPPL